MIVGDDSTDGSDQVLAGLGAPRLVLGSHPVNRGKGAAVRTAVALARRVIEVQGKLSALLGQLATDSQRSTSEPTP